MSVDQDFSDNISFSDGAVEFTFCGKKHIIKRPSALEAVQLNKRIKSFKEDDLETMVEFYIEVLIKHGLPDVVAKELDLFSLGEVFRALNSPAVKKK